MDRVQCVSLPRSGHNLLVGHLQQYFQSSNTCSQTRRAKRKFALFVSGKQREVGAAASENPFHYCEYYYACRSHPCNDKQNTFQKSHDFDLLLPVHQRQKYLVQKRNRDDLMISWFEMRLLKGREQDSQSGFDSFLARHRKFLDGFVAKWVDAPIQQRLVLDYDNYLDQPAKWLSQVLLFFDPDLVIDERRLDQVIKDVRPAKDNDNFRFRFSEQVLG